MQKQKSTELFHTGEDLAAKYLISKGYAILHRNFRADTGEIDIVAQNEENLVFVEVKTRSKHSIRQALMNIGYTKQRRISTTAQRYIILHPEYVKPKIRFDIIILLYFGDTDTYKLEHLEDAFVPVL
ncbi:MAG: YraN family protein [Candidatus Syntrophosphaera sp.]|nr:YraN family protein [Candidatus Syntrophosphaera sp.]